MSGVRRTIFSTLMAVPLAAQTVSLAPEVVTAVRTPQPTEQVAFSVASLDHDVLADTPSLTLDGALRTVPSFGLFRRSDSLIANPTAQGVSLRGLGPSGASRSLVLLDGVPLNDPFGGWVAWTKLPRDGLARVEIVPGGGATAWGNAALGGVVQLFTEPATEKQAQVTAAAGDFGTRSAEFSVTQPVGRGALQLLGSDFSTDGFSLVAPGQRGMIDIAAWSRHRWLAARWREPLGENLELTATARGYEEFRGNGTPYQRNGSREKFASLALAGKPASFFSWNAVAYAQDQSFASTFSSVNTTRTTETPASDQFAVPSTALGAAWTGTWSHADGALTTFGADARLVRGETRENYTFSAGDFTRQRVAGGDQAVAGLFALHEQPLAPDLHAMVGVRLDDWREDDGHRRETDRVSGVLLRDDHYASHDGLEFSPSAGLVWQAAKEWRMRFSAQQAFRRPTLNELYRPFRQGTTVVEANPDLRTEHVTSGELGTDFTTGAFTFGASAFWNELRDAIDNVTLAHGPGNFPLFGQLPAGGVGRQRLNVDRVRVRGLELTSTWRVNDTLSFNAAALFNDAVVRRASVAPGLVGNRVAQVPRQTVSLGATWRAPGGVTVTPRIRWLGRQFEDDENTLRLGEAVVADLGATHALGPHGEIFLSIENLGNARVETGRSADGVVNTGTPRLAFGGLRWKL
jgi:outer membrane receptor protein involved in Fe transport